MKDDRLPKIVLVGQPSRAKQKAGRPRIGWKDVVRKDLRGIRTSWEVVKKKALNILGWRRCLRNYVGLMQLGAALVAVVVVYDASN